MVKIHNNTDDVLVKEIKCSSKDDFEYIKTICFGNIVSRDYHVKTKNKEVLKYILGHCQPKVYFEIRSHHKVLFHNMEETNVIYKNVIENSIDHITIRDKKIIVNFDSFTYKIYLK